MKSISITISIALMMGALALGSAAEVKSCRRSDQSKFEHVLLFSIDGLHQADLADYIAAKPKSTFAGLVDSGVEFTNADTSKPSDSFPGLVAQLTGGHPVTTGVWYDIWYDRSLYTPGSDCTGAPGTITTFTQLIDIDPKDINGGGGTNLTALPRILKDGKCEPLYPHQYPRVNNLFQIARSHGLVTAWADKHTAAYDIARGTDGQGLTELYAPEIASVPVEVNATIAYDTLHVNAFLNWIKGKDALGEKQIGIPSVFGGNFQAVNVAQKNVGTPSAALSQAIDFVDASLGKVVAALKAAGIYEESVIIVSAINGNSPRDMNEIKRVNPAILPAVLGNVSISYTLTHDAGMFFLANQSDTFKAASSAYANADTSEPGTLFDISEADIAVHGGFNFDDINVPLIVSSPLFKKQKMTEHVETTQIAPTILCLLDLDPNELEAVQIEGTKVLPIF
ncbi:hypothetical protein BGZ80_005962 [Entomortierella chlamydospora]|uniref:Type i phosphodiesterase nucleotide pyrophosphatase n=1 Tax=Entomortierella chlamydospora TaxID=101097 RepID=A0A9P6MZS3_9FUNG|nr:hypothetical protein BGZ80_005962 [Entomortierella chlamydospora]